MWPDDLNSALPEGLPFPPDDLAPASHLSDMLVTWSTRGMGCEFQVLTTIDGQQAVAPVLQAGFSLIEQLEKQMTTYDPASELESINSSAASNPVPVSENLFQLLLEATSLSESTRGAFDITAAPLSRLWNFHRRDGRLPAADDIEATLQNIGWEKLLLDVDSRTARFHAAGMRLDLGGIGKGHAIDELNRLLSSAGATDYLIHGGQSSIYARGSRLRSDEETGWQVGISHPLIPDRRLALISLSEEAIGTSGSGRQSFIHNGRRYGHILDPRTGWPANHRLSVTVIAPRAAYADAVATALFVMDDNELLDFASRHPQLGIIALESGANAGRVIARVFNSGNRVLKWLDPATDVVVEPDGELS